MLNTRKDLGTWVVMNECQPREKPLVAFYRPVYINYIILLLFSNQ